METKWLSWAIVAAVVVFFIWKREKGGGTVMNFFGTPSNPVNAPTSGCSFCGVGTIAAGAPSPRTTGCGCVATPKSIPPHMVFPLCRPRIGVISPITRSIQPPPRVFRSNIPIPVAGGL